MNLFDYVLFMWIYDYVVYDEIKIKKEPSFISCILSFILLYIPILLIISLITEIFNITKFENVFKIFTIIYIILFMINIVLIAIHKVKKLIK